MRNNCCQRHSHPHLAPAKPYNDSRKKRLRNDRRTPASHFRSDNTESPARKWHQSTTTLCGSSADIQTQACETAMVLRPSKLHTTSVDGSYEPVIILYNHRTYTRWKLHFFRSGIPSPCYPFPIWFILCVGDVLRFCLQMVDIHETDFGDFNIDPCLTNWLRSPLM